MMRHGILVVALLFASALGFASCGRNGGTLAAVTITPTDSTIARGTKQQFSAMAIFSNGTQIDWTTASLWSTSAPVVAPIGNALGTYGLVTSASDTTNTGTSTVTVTATDAVNNISGNTTLYITTPQAITITPANPHLALGKQHQFKATATLPDISSGGTTTIEQEISSYATWTTTIPTIADVSSLGLVTAGTATGQISIVATDPTGTISGTTTLTVTDTPLLSLTIAQIDTTHFTATGHYADTTVPTTLDFTYSVTWKSSNTRVATIDDIGHVTILASGTTTIKATDPITAISSPGSTLVVP